MESLSRPGPASHIFLGRSAQLTVLRNAFEETERGAAVCVHVRGASGVGKTRVIRNFLESVRESEPRCVILSGRCYESEAAPHKGLDELIDRLARFLGGLEPALVQSLLPRYFQFLTRLFPVLQQFGPLQRGVPEIADPREQRRRAFGSLRECLRRIAEMQPLVLWIDDLQWCDSDTVSLLNDIVQSPDPFACLILLSYRDADLDRNPALSELDRTNRDGSASVRTLEIENLSHDEACDLAAQLLRQRSDENWDRAAVTIAPGVAGESLLRERARALCLVGAGPRRPHRRSVRAEAHHPAPHRPSAGAGASAARAHRGSRPAAVRRRLRRCGGAARALSRDTHHTAPRAPVAHARIGLGRGAGHLPRSNP